MVFDNINYFESAEFIEMLGNLKEEFASNSAYQKYLAGGKTLNDLAAHFKKEDAYREALEENVLDFVKLMENVDTLLSQDADREKKIQAFDSYKQILGRISLENVKTEEELKGMDPYEIKYSMAQNVQNYQHDKHYETVSSLETSIAYLMAQMCQKHAENLLTFKRIDDVNREYEGVQEDLKSKNQELDNKMQKVLGEVVTYQGKFGSVDNAASEYEKIKKQGQELMSEENINKAVSEAIAESDKTFYDPEKTECEEVKALDRELKSALPAERQRLQSENEERIRIADENARLTKEWDDKKAKYERDSMEHEEILGELSQNANKIDEDIKKAEADAPKLEERAKELEEEVFKMTRELEDYMALQGRGQFNVPPIEHTVLVENLKIEKALYDANVYKAMAFFFNGERDTENLLHQAVHMKPNELEKLKKKVEKAGKNLSEKEAKLKNKGKNPKEDKGYLEDRQKFKEMDTICSLATHYLNIKGLEEYKSFLPMFKNLEEQKDSVNLLDMLEEEVSKYDSRIQAEKDKYKEYYESQDVQKEQNIKVIDQEELAKKNQELLDAHEAVIKNNANIQQLKENREKTANDITAENSRFEKIPPVNENDKPKLQEVEPPRSNEEIEKIISDREKAIRDEFAPKIDAAKETRNEKIRNDIRTEKINTGTKLVDSANEKLEKIGNLKRDMSDTFKKIAENQRLKNQKVGSLEKAAGSPQLEMYKTIQKRLEFFENNIKNSTKGGHRNSDEFEAMFAEIRTANSYFTIAIKKMSEANSPQAAANIEKQLLPELKDQLSYLKEKTEFYIDKKKGFHPFPSNMRIDRLAFANTIKEFTDSATKNIDSSTMLKEAETGRVNEIKNIDIIKTNAKSGGELFHEMAKNVILSKQASVEKAASKDLSKSQIVESNKEKETVADNLNRSFI